MRLLTCAHCGAYAVLRTVHYIEDGLLWSVPVPICTNPPCLRRQGGTATQHKPSKRSRSESVSTPPIRVSR